VLDATNSSLFTTICIWNRKLIDGHCSFRLTFLTIWRKPRKRVCIERCDFPQIHGTIFVWCLHCLSFLQHYQMFSPLSDLRGNEWMMARKLWNAGRRPPLFPVSLPQEDRGRVKMREWAAVLTLGTLLSKCFAYSTDYKFYQQLQNRRDEVLFFTLLRYSFLTWGEGSDHGNPPSLSKLSSGIQTSQSLSSHLLSHCSDEPYYSWHIPLPPPRLLY
jgi:hypothetical protein